MRTFWQISAKTLIDYLKSQPNETVANKLCILISLMAERNIGFNAIATNDFELFLVCFEQVLKPRVVKLRDAPRRKSGPSSFFGNQDQECLSDEIHSKILDVKVVVVYFIRTLAVLFGQTPASPALREITRGLYQMESFVSLGSNNFQRIANLDKLENSRDQNSYMK